MAEFEHKGIKIELRESGQFTATIDGKYIAKPSLAAMKKFIDNRFASNFTPFEAYFVDRWGSKPTLVRVVGIQKPRANASSWNSSPKFILEGRSETVGPKELLLNTPENMAAYKKASEFDEETRRIKELREVQSGEFWEAVKHPEIE